LCQKIIKRDSGSGGAVVILATAVASHAHFDFSTLLSCVAKNAAV
jgi:hypothetical protein